jgi:alkylation response protein AidB-like acyl-CoA dehydrogenase
MAEQGCLIWFGAAVNEYVCAANYSLGMYPGLSHGAMELIYAFGTEEQKNSMLTKL